MIRSMDILSRNFNVLQEKQQNLSANAANVSTPGFKFQDIVQSTLAVEEMVHFAGGAELNEELVLGDFTFGNEIDETVTHFGNGTLQQTDQPTDFAIQGDGFFTIEGPNGENYYTRNGQFTTNETGELVTLEGYAVQTGGAAGVVVTSFGENTNNLVNVGDGYFTGAGGQVNTGAASVQQGFLENSNVEMADVMVDLIQIQREFESNQRILQSTDETLRKATTEVGSVR